VSVQKGNGMKIIIDLDKCESSGRCYDNAPEVFDEGPKNQSVLKVADIPDDDFDLQREARSAAMMCPAGAIEIID